MGKFKISSVKIKKHVSDKSGKTNYNVVNGTCHLDPLKCVTIFKLKSKNSNNRITLQKKKKIRKVFQTLLGN